MPGGCYHAKTETKAIERTLDFAIAEHGKNRLAFKAPELFLNSGIETKDVYGTLFGYLREAFFDTSRYIAGLRRGNEAALAQASGC